MPLVIPDQVQADILETMTAASGKLENATLVLYKNNVAPSSGSEVGDFEAADFSGTAAESSAIVWGDPYVNDDGRVVVVGDTKQWVHSGGATNNNVYGTYMIGADNSLIAAEQFLVPVIMEAELDGLAIMPVFSLEEVSMIVTS